MAGPSPRTNPEPHETSAALRLAVFGAMAGLLCVLIVVSAAFTPIPAAPRVEAGYRVDVNTADIATLQLLPGVGPSMATRIIAERSEHPFANPRDLLRVRGIGEKTLERIKPYAAFPAAGE